MSIKNMSIANFFQRIIKDGLIGFLVLLLTIGLSSCYYHKKTRKTNVHIVEPGTVQPIKPIKKKEKDIIEKPEKKMEKPVKKEALPKDFVTTQKERYRFGIGVKDPTLGDHFNLVVMKPWRPLRYFGPFLQEDFEEFDQVQIILEGNTCTWYYNNYFNMLTTNQQFIYKMYYRTSWGAGTSFDSTILPSNSTPSLTFEPGGGFIPPTGDSNQYITPKPVLLSLNRIEYSSRYGGSIKLVFSLADITPVTVDLSHPEDFEFEFQAKVRSNPEAPAGTAPQFDNYLFDAKELEINIFVWPTPRNFNPANSFTDATDSIHVEFAPGNVTAYKNGNPIPAEDADVILSEIFKTLGTNIRNASLLSYSTIYKQAARFTYGFLHDQFTLLLPPWKQMTDPRDTLDSIAISDDYIDIQTGTRTAIFTMRFRTHDVVLDADPGGGEKIRLELSYLHAYKNKPSVQRRGRVYEVESGGETRWEWVGSWNLDECNDILNINANTLVTEIDTLNPDDDFGFYVNIFIPPCDELEASDAADDYFVLVERLTGEQNLYEGTSDAESGHYLWIMETYLKLR